MKISAVISAVTLSLMTCIPSAASDQGDARDWGRGVHVFGSVLFDFGYQTVSAGMFSASLKDCSGEQYLCFNSSMASLVVPRYCQDIGVGSSWSSGGVVTKVLAQSEEPQGHLTVPGRQWYYLMSDGNSSVVFVYSKVSGVQGIIFDLRSAPTSGILQSGVISPGTWPSYEGAKRRQLLSGARRLHVITSRVAPLEHLEAPLV